MKEILIITITLPLFLFLTSIGSNAEGQHQFLVQVSPASCTHGLHAQPGDGPFSVFVFCDDAGGVNIGVILTQPGAGPGKLELKDTKTWDKWSCNDRFWQDSDWATDVTSFAWSPSYRYLYVATSAIYGEGGIFKLDLQNRTSSRLAPSDFGERYHSIGIDDVFSSTIISFDIQSNKMEIELTLRSSGNTVVKIPIPILE